MSDEQGNNMKTEQLLCFLLPVVYRLKSFRMGWWPEKNSGLSCFG